MRRHNIVLDLIKVIELRFVVLIVINIRDLSVASMCQSVFPMDIYYEYYHQ